MENYRAGGVDRVVVDTINYWPNRYDKFVIFCNEEHLGLSTIRRNLSIPDRVQFSCYKSPTYMRKELANTHLLRRAWYYVVWCYVLMIKESFALRRRFLEYNLDNIYVHNGGWPAARTTRSAIFAALLCGIKNRALIIHNYPCKNSIFIKLQEMILEFVLSKLCVVVTVSKDTALSITRTTYLSQPVVIYNGIRSMSGQSEGASNKINLLGDIDKDTYVILSIGTLEKRRGHHVLLDVYKNIYREIPDSILLIAGTGTQKEIIKINKLIREYKLSSNVMMLGFVENIENYIDISDVVVNTVQEFESFGLVAVEAMALKKPVVASKIGGIPEVIVDNKTGYLDEKKDVAGFSDKIIQLYLSPEKRVRFGNNGYDRYSKLFRAEKMSILYSKLFSDCK